MTVFTPDQELLDFADWFSKNYKELECERLYLSSKENYAITLVPLDKPDSEHKIFVSVVTESNGMIKFQKDILCLEAYTHDFVFYLILWCVCIYRLKFHGYPYNNLEMRADTLTTEYYLTTGRSKKHFFIGFLEHLKYNLSDYNHSRASKIIRSLFDNLDTDAQV